MKTFARSITLALGLSVGALFALPAGAEPLQTLVGFSASDYDTGNSDVVVVKITRNDQDPAAETEEVTVDLVVGGDAVENVDYRFAGNPNDGNPGRLSFGPGVKERTLTIHALRKGEAKKLQLSLSNPAGGGSPVTGENANATVSLSGS